MTEYLPSAVNIFGANGLISRVGVSHYPHLSPGYLSSTFDTLYFTFDERGNVCEEMYKNEGVRQRKGYASYGTPLTDTSEVFIGIAQGVCFGFGAQFGYYTDFETGLILCTYRYYDPQTGRWIN
ncbi:MAG: hypothetical protein H8F28_09500, partial [Fibrella sp.]|nr:hypothetical protein [Armatimonadota bacterium]